MAEKLNILRLGYRKGRDPRITTHLALVSRALGADNFILAGDGQPGVAIHLTMYGQPYRQVIPQIRKDRPVVVVVGGAKVPSEVFELSQYNLAVGNQPHSEVAALALFLEAWNGPSASEKLLEDGELIIHPSAKGKDVTDTK